ncbi:hypothetical protein HYV12_01835 [Candidatus Dojkabacteria bacterium]|nr:hypothetical protein [Candidatus Dojkabacteria bacterium]
MNTVFKSRLWIGVFLLLLSLFPLIFDFTFVKGFLLAIFHIFYDIGIVLVCDSIIEINTGKSFLKSLLSTPRNILLFALASNIGGLLLDSLANYFGGMWYYPHWSSGLYLALFSVGFTVYFSSILFSYLAIKSCLDRWSEGRELVTKSYSFEKSLYRILFLLGISAIAYVVYRIFYTTSFFRDFVFEISKYKAPYLNIYDMFVAFFGVWFLFEYLSFKKGQNNFIKDLLHGYMNPLYAIIFAATILALYMEIQNLPIGLWIYSNMPLDSLKIVNLPILLFVGWPLHYIAFLAIYRYFGEPLSNGIWKGDVIE